MNKFSPEQIVAVEIECSFRGHSFQQLAKGKILKVINPIEEYEEYEYLVEVDLWSGAWGESNVVQEKMRESKLSQIICFSETTNSFLLKDRP